MEQSSFESQSRGCAKTPILTVKQPGTTTPLLYTGIKQVPRTCIVFSGLFCLFAAMPCCLSLALRFCFALFCSVLFCFVLFCFVLFCLVLFCLVCFVFVSLLSLNPRPFVQSFFHIHRRYSIVGDTVGKVRQAGAHQLIHGNAQAAPVTGSTLRSTPTDSRQ